MELLRKPITYLSGVLAGIWVLVAFLNPENDYFLSPILIAGAAPISYRVAKHGPVDLGTAIGSALAGVFTVALTTFLLSYAGRLQGPGLLAIGGPVLEALALGLVGAVIGVIAAVAPVGSR
jgi:hypothetical protein